MTTRRTTLGILTKGVVAVGTLGVGGAVLNTCAPDAAIVAQRDMRTVTAPTSGQIQMTIGEHPVMFKRLTDAQKSALYDLDDNTLIYPNMNRHHSTPLRATADNILHGNNKNLLVISLLCPRRGCVTTQDAGDWGGGGGFFCGCYGTHFDGLGRMRKGIATNNMLTPDLERLGDGRYLINALASNWRVAR